MAADETAAADEQRVTPLELFFDLVFVFAITQVTAFMATDPTWTGLGRGLLILAALWWAWAAYAWLTNTLATDAGIARVTIFAAMAAMLVVALAVPEAFDDDAFVFAGAYLIVRGLHLLVYVVGSHDEGERGAALRMFPPAFAGPLFIVAAAFFDSPLQEVLWGIGLLIDFAGPLWYGPEGFRVSPSHFAERFALIIIIALGESIVAIGVGAEGFELDAGLIVAAVLAIAIVCALWWAYFDVVALVAERRFREASAAEQVLIARDSYSWLHFPMIAGIVLVALGIKKTMGDVDAHLKDVPAAALFGGVALYLLGHIGFRLRNVRSINKPRLAATVLCLACVPFATEVDALVALATAAALCSGLIAYEAIAYREARARVRAGG